MDAQLSCSCMSALWTVRSLRFISLSVRGHFILKRLLKYFQQLEHSHRFFSNTQYNLQILIIPIQLSLHCFPVFGFLLLKNAFCCLRHSINKMYSSLLSRSLMILANLLLLLAFSYSFTSLAFL